MCRRKKFGELRGEHWGHSLGLDHLSQNPNVQPQKQTFMQGDAFENAAFEHGFEIVKFRNWS